MAESRRRQPITWCRLLWWHSYLDLRSSPIAMGQYADQLHIKSAFHSGTAAEFHKSLSSNDKSKLVILISGFKWFVCQFLFFFAYTCKLIAMNSNTNNTPKGYSCTTFFFFNASFILLFWIVLWTSINNKLTSTSFLEFIMSALSKEIVSSFEKTNILYHSYSFC